MTVTSNRRTRVGIASLVMALVGGLGAACTADTEKSAESDAPSERVSESAAPPSESKSRAPVAAVLFSGRIAYPHITLTTWGTCPFSIERVRRLNGTLLVVGREASSGCESKDTRHVTTKRLTRVHSTGGENVDQVTVVSDHPAYRVEARVRPLLA